MPIIKYRDKWPTPESNIFIYGLVDPISNQLHYVGQTTQGLLRMRDHCRVRKNKITNCYDRKTCWVKSLKTKGLIFEIVILQYCKDQKELDESEQFYIEYFRYIGTNLYNSLNGGLYKDKADRDLISKRTKEAMKNPSVIKKMRDKRIGQPSYMKGRHFDEAFRQKIHLSNLKRSIKIIDSDGNYYESLLQASKIFKCTPTSIRRCLLNPTRSINGITFKKAE